MPVAHNPVKSRLAGAIARRLGRRRGSERLSMGRCSYDAPIVIAYEGDSAKAVVGSFTSIAADVRLMVGGNHRTDWVSTFPFRVVFGLPGAIVDGHPAPAKDIVIGNDVWIGRGATVLSGVQIGNGAVVGAGSLVTKDVRPYAIVAGNPARELRRRFNDQQISALEELRWWDWPVTKILDAVPLLSSDDVNGFLEKFSGDAQAGTTGARGAPSRDPL